MRSPISIAVIKTLSTAAELNHWLTGSVKGFAVNAVELWRDAGQPGRYSIELDRFEWKGIEAWTKGWHEVHVALTDGVESGRLQAFEPTRFSPAGQ